MEFQLFGSDWSVLILLSPHCNIVLIFLKIYLAGNHTIAIIKGKEEYQTLKASLANVIRDVNATIQEGHLVVDGQKVNLEFYLGGDYKVN